MIKNIKLFINNNEKSIELAKLVRDKLNENGFIIDDNNFDLGIAIGGDGSFLRMIKKNKFDSEPYYVGINSGHLGFLQEVKSDEINKLIEELKTKKYKVSNIGIQETKIVSNDNEEKYYSLNEIILRDIDLKILKTNIFINDDFLEEYVGDGIMIATSTGSTAYNLCYGGSIIPPEFSTLQITPMAPINSKVYKTMPNSIIEPEKTKIRLFPKNKDILLTIDGDNRYFNEVDHITSSIEDKKIKMLRFSHYNFAQKINEKFLSN